MISELVRVRVKPKTVAEVVAMAVQHDETEPDMWRMLIERGLPIVAVIQGGDPQRVYGCYSEDELAAALEPIAAVIQAFFARRNGAVHAPLAPQTRTASVASAPLPLPAFHTDAADALTGLGIDLGI